MTDPRLNAIAGLFDTLEKARDLLEAVGVSYDRLPPFGHGPTHGYWHEVRRQLDGGIAPGKGFDDLVAAAREMYPANPDLQSTTGPAALRPASRIDPRVANVFVGRDAELDQLTRHLLDADSPAPVAVCALEGMGGVGKSYLADRFAWLHREAFPGGYARLVLDPRSPQDAAACVADLAAQLDLPDGPHPEIRLRARLLDSPTLLHVENVDSDTAYQIAAKVLAALDGCRAIVTGRLGKLGRGRAWTPVELAPFDRDTSLAQLWQELGTRPDAAERREEHARLVEALGHLPLAVHLAAGHLEHGRTVAGFLERLRASGLRLAPVDAAEGLEAGQERRILAEVFQLSLDLLRDVLEQSGVAADACLAGLASLGHAPASGFGRGLGAALAGLPAADFEELTLQARRLSLLLDAPRAGDAEPAWKVHPMVAELLRTGEEDAVVARATEWFVERLPERPAGEEEAQGVAWHEVHAESDALAWWLRRVPVEDRYRVQQAGDWMAWVTGPYLPWLAFCEKALECELPESERSDFLWTASRTAEKCGEHAKVEAMAHEKAVLDTARGAEREAALAWGTVADIATARGDLDEALRIRREESLPVYEKLGDVREYAVTMGKIADIFQVRGDLDEALRIRREESLPIYEKLGDVRSRAVTMGQIADIFHANGDLDEALRIRREEELPVYEKLGDVRSRAVTMGQIAGIFQARGDLDEALRIRREESLPVYEKLGDVRERAATLHKIAAIEVQRKDFQGAAEHLSEAFEIAMRMNIADGIAFIGRDLGFLLAGAGQMKEGRNALSLARAAFEKLGRSADAEQIDGILAQIDAASEG